MDTNDILLEEEETEGRRPAVRGGTLYIVATPIGNARDMSVRGAQVLGEVDIIAAEDTRRSVVLLNKLEIRNKLMSNHKFNEYGKARYFIEQLKAGKSIAVITDAGTPCISDPGNELIKAAIAEDIPVIGIPGACAAVTALSISGFDLSTFFFYGFFPREAPDRRKVVEKMRRGMTRTYVFYESPKRVMDAVEFFIEEGVDCRLCLCNDLTKFHETTFRGEPTDVRDQLLAKGNYDKGEFVIVLELAEGYLIQKKEHTVTAEALLVDKMIREDCRAKDAIRLLMADENNTYSKNELYAASLSLKELFNA